MAKEPTDDPQIEDVQDPTELSDPTPMQVPPPPGSGEVAQSNAVQLARAAAIREVGTTISRILAWLTVLVLGILLALGLVSIWPDLFNVVVSPVQSNTVQIATLEAQIDALEAELAVPVDELNAQQEQINALQGQVAEVQAQLTEAGDRLAAAEGDIDAQVAAVEDIGAMLDGFQTDLNVFEGGLSYVSTRVPNPATFDAYNRQLLIMRAWQATTVARLRMAENNPGLAGDHVDTAILSLEGALALSEAADAQSTATLEQARDRLLQAQATLVDSPFLAFADLDTAWLLLSNLVTAVDFVDVGEPAGDDQVITPTVTLSPTPIETETPTPAAEDQTPVPSVTPEG